MWGNYSPVPTSLISIRPAMLRRVRGEKWGVIMMRRLASEKESWWGWREIISSTITTGESCSEFCPARRTRERGREREREKRTRRERKREGDITEVRGQRKAVVRILMAC